MTRLQWLVVLAMSEQVSVNQAAVAERLGITRRALRAELYGSFGHPGIYERLGVSTDVQVVTWFQQVGVRHLPLGVVLP